MKPSRTLACAAATAAALCLPAAPVDAHWAWIGGEQSTNTASAHGTQGVADAANAPGSRRDAATWTDADGRFWLFGGSGEDASGTFGSLNDLWTYDPATGLWTWVKGSTGVNAAGTYGTMGQAAPGNTPGARANGVSWLGADGSLWLFGGSGRDANGTNGRLNDLWRFDPATGNWTWTKGWNQVNGVGNYGQVGVEAGSNAPSARNGAVGWTGTDGRLWLFGGSGFAGTTSSGSLNDLWRFDPATGNWTWVGGAQALNTLGVYGTLGVADAGNWPGARDQPSAWRGPDGSLWLFAGTGYSSEAGFGRLSDLWRFSPATGLWTWVGGSPVRNEAPVYGVQGVGAPGNRPGARFDAEAWGTSDGAVWIFGGSALDIDEQAGEMNDLWRRDPDTGHWAWIAGDQTRRTAGIYGILGTGAQGNTPGARRGAASWVGADDALWLFGGFGNGSIENLGRLNDLWRREAPAASVGDWMLF